MLKFLAQIIDNRVKHDFVFELTNAIDYQNWRGNPMQIEYCTLEDIQNDTILSKIDSDEIIQFIPVGTIEFVFAFIDKFIKENGSKCIHPLNIPESLMKYSGCQIVNITLTDVNRPDVVQYLLRNYLQDNIFIKSNDIIKYPNNGITEIVSLLDKSKFINGNYQVKSIINNIVSEYRCFIHNNELVGIQHYNGDFDIFPNIDKVNEIIEDAIKLFNENLPAAYTVDIAVTSDNDVILMECHELFSCGFYGFNSCNIVPFMYARTFNSLKHRINK